MQNCRNSNTRKSKRRVKPPQRLGDWMQARVHRSFDSKEIRKTYVPGNAVLSSGKESYKAKHTKRGPPRLALGTDIFGISQIKVNPVTLEPYYAHTENTTTQATTHYQTQSPGCHILKKTKQNKINVKKKCPLCVKKVPFPHLMWGIEGTYTCPVCFKDFKYNKTAGCLTCGHFTCQSCFLKLPH